MDSGEVIYMDLYGKLNKEIELKEYSGMPSDTADVVVNNKMNTISTEVKRVPNELSFNLNGTIVSYDGSKSKTIPILTLEQVQDMINAKMGTTFPLQVNVEHGTYIGSHVAPYNGSAFIKVTPDEGYGLPDEVFVANAVLESYNKDNGTIVVNTAANTVEIEVTCISNE